MEVPYPNTLQDLFKSQQNVLITDGAAKGNPGPAGWAYILLSGEKNIAEEFNGYSPRDTNNRMEMTGALKGLESVKNHKLKNQLYLLSDSQYLIDALSSWRHGWKKRGWVKSDGNPVLHVDIWKLLDVLVDSLKPKLFYVEAHKGHPANTRCDFLAVEAAAQKESSLYMGSLEDYSHFAKISFTKFYPAPVYVCMRSGQYREFKTWPEAEDFMKKNAGYRVKKIFSPEELELLL